PIFRMSALRRSDPALSQPARTELADSSRKMPVLQAAHLATLPGHRSTHGLALSRLLPQFWLDAGDVEVRRVRLPAAGVDFHRRGNQASSRRDDSARPGSGNWIQPGGSGE